MEIHDESYLYEKQLDYSSRLLPAWFASRMLYDQWHFGVMMTSGTIIGVEQIKSVRVDCSGNLWLDVNLLGSYGTKYPIQNIFTAPTSRTMASINVSHIMAVFELADT